MEKFRSGTIRKQVLDFVFQICKNSKDGIAKRSYVVKELNKKGFNRNTIIGSIYDIQEAIKKNEINELRYDYENHEFILKHVVEEKSQSTSDISKSVLPKEEIFYKPFADFLVHTLKECTKAIALGGSQFKDKWGTPDVLGIYKFPEIAPIRPFPEIVTAEIKLDETQIITAFGQACAYKLFSHKVYLVIPSSTPEEDIARTESLCMKFGIGLITFDKDNPENPKFTIRTRAIKHEPDYSFVNNYLHKLTNEQQIRLFG